MKCPSCSNNFCVACVDNLVNHQITNNKPYTCPLCRVKKRPRENFEIVGPIDTLRVILETMHQDVDNSIVAYNELNKVQLAKVDSFIASIDLLSKN